VQSCLRGLHLSAQTQNRSKDAQRQSFPAFSLSLSGFSSGFGAQEKNKKQEKNTDVGLTSEKD
jgi:hypothetical protein